METKESYELKVKNWKRSVLITLLVAPLVVFVCVWFLQNFKETITESQYFLGCYIALAAFELFMTAIFAKFWYFKRMKK